MSSRLCMSNGADLAASSTTGLLPELARWSRASVAQPGTQHADEVRAVDRFGYVVRSTGFDALLSIPLHRLCGERDDRPGLEERQAADLRHRGVAIHLRHHHVDQGDVYLSVLSKRRQSIDPVIRRGDLHALPFEQCGQREDVPHVVVDDQDLLAGEQALALYSALLRPLVLCALAQNRADLIS